MYGFSNILAVLAYSDANVYVDTVCWIIFFACNTKDGSQTNFYNKLPIYTSSHIMWLKENIRIRVKSDRMHYGIMFSKNPIKVYLTCF